MTSSSSGASTSVLPTISGTTAGPIGSVLHVAGDTLTSPNSLVGGVVNNTVSPLLQGITGTPASGAPNPGVSVGVASTVLTPVLAGATVNTGTALGGLLAPVTGGTSSGGLLSPVTNTVGGLTAPVTGGSGTGGLLNGVLR